MGADRTNQQALAEERKHGIVIGLERAAAYHDEAAKAAWKKEHDPKQRASGGWVAWAVRREAHEADAKRIRKLKDDVR